MDLRRLFEVGVVILSVGGFVVLLFVFVIWPRLLNNPNWVARDPDEHNNTV